MFYKLEDNTCTAIAGAIAIPNCSSYVDNTAFCSICENGYFINDLQRSCERSTVSIDDCLTFALDSDQCLVCRRDLTLSQTGKACTVGRSTSFCDISISDDASSGCLVC